MIINRTRYTAAMWEHGKRIGIIMNFDAATEAREQLMSPGGKMPNTPIMFIRYNEAIPDADRHGWCIEEIKTVIAPAIVHSKASASRVKAFPSRFLLLSRGYVVNRDRIRVSDMAGRNGRAILLRPCTTYKVPAPLHAGRLKLLGRSGRSRLFIFTRFP